MAWWNFGKVKENENRFYEAFYSLMGVNQVSWLKNESATYVEKGYSDNEIVYSVLQVLLNKIKTVPAIISEVVDEKAFRKYNGYSVKSADDITRIASNIFKRKALQELGEHPLYDLLERPNEYQTWTEFLEALYGFRKLLGEAFIYGIGPGTDSKDFGKFTELHVLPSHLVNIVYSGDYNHPVKGYTFTIGTSNVIPLEAANVMHWKSWNPNFDTNGTQLRGLSPLKPGNKTLTRNGFNQTAQTQSFVNGGVAHLLSGDPNQKMSPDQMSQMNDLLKKQLKGADNFNNILMTNGFVRVDKIGANPADLQLLESDKQDRIKICSIFGVDPILIGDQSSSSYNNKEQAYKALVTNVIMPDLIELRDKLQIFLMDRYQETSALGIVKKRLHLDFDTTVFPELQPDLKLMKEVYGSMWQITPNELRSIFNWDASEQEGMNEIYIPSGMMKLSDQGIPDSAFSKAFENVKYNDYE